MFGVTTAIIQDKRIKRNDGTYAIKLRVIYQRITKYYPLGIHLSEDDWKEVNEKKPKSKYKKNKLLFNKTELNAIEVIRTLSPFSFEAFEKTYNKRSDLSKDVFSLIDDYIKILKKNKQFGTAESYGSSKSSFILFLKEKKRKKLNFGDITPEWLQDYEDWMLSEEESITTVGVYLRNLRAIINKAINDGLFNREFYPFGKWKYQIPSGRNIKKALTMKEIQLIFEYVPRSEEENKARDIWLLSYLFNGANFKDIAMFQYRNIRGNSLIFIRNKTKKTTKKDIQPVIISLIPETVEMINKWGVKPIDADQYIFGFIDGTETEELQRVKIKQAAKTNNKYIKRIGERLGLPLKLTLGVSRHTWATIMKNLGASDEIVGDGLGHQLLSTTKNYLGSFEDEVREQFQSKLLKFN
ncbi:MAG: site-specific integrase [Salinivirgaceae bacterium]